jgi:16S rRNA processing protein RimM
MTPGPFVPLGRVVKTHGLKGEVSVMPAADLPFVLPVGLEVWFVPPPPGVRTGRIEDVRRGPKGPLVKVSGVDDITLAQRTVGSELIARASDLPAEWTEPVATDDDPIGLIVTDVKRGVLGEIVAVIVTGANDVWVVEGRLGEVLLPVIDDVVLAVDFEARTASVRALDGLLPEEDGA